MALLALCVLGPLIASCSRARAEAPAATPDVPVVIALAEARTVADELRAVGQVEAWSTVSLRSQVNGVVTAVHFEEGADVRRGELLFSIDPRPFAAVLHQAQAALARDRSQHANAEADRQRADELLRAGILAQSDFDARRTAAEASAAQVQVDLAAVENARLNVGYCSIRAPMDGRAGAILVFPGNTVTTSGGPLVELAQTRPIKVSFAIPESRLADVRAAAGRGPLTVAVAANGPGPPAGGQSEAKGASPTGGGLPAGDAPRGAGRRTSADERSSGGESRGELEFVDNQVDRTTGTIRLKARLANDDRRLWPGAFVDVRLVLGTRSNAVVVPASAVQPGQDGPYVYVVKPDSTVESRAVRAVDYPGDVAVVEHGLAAGERVVVDGQLRLVPGAKVAARPAPGSSASPAAARS